MQYSLLQKHTRQEFDLNAKITANAIKAAIDMDDYSILTSLLEDIKNEKNYAFVAIIEKDKKNNKVILSCYPNQFKNRVLIPNESKYYYSSSPIKTGILSGEVLIASSKAEDIRILKELNRPLTYLTIIALIASTVLFGLSILFLSRPIFKAVDIANQLGNRNFKIDIALKAGKDEISSMNNALYHLRQNLVELDTENKNLMDNLEDRIKEITLDIRNKNQLNTLMLDVSKLFLESDESNDKHSIIESSIDIIRDSLGMEFMNIFRVEDQGLLCQFNVDRCSFVKIINSEHYSKIESLFDGDKNSLLIIDKEKASKNTFASEIFKEFPSSKHIYFYFFDDGVNPPELLIMVSKKLKTNLSLSEIEGTIEVYFSLYSNFRKGWDYEKELMELNRTLESKVLEKTRINLEISNSLIAQDKLVTIGELSAGIAHDLNTPLASIKAASQNIHMIIEELLTMTHKLSPEDLNFILNFYSAKMNYNFFQSSSQKTAQIKELKEYIEALTGVPDTNGLAKKLVDVGLDKTQKKSIQEALDTFNPSMVLDVMKTTYILNSFISGIETSVDRSTQIVLGLNRYVREDLTQNKELLDLSSNIKVIEALFRFRLRGNINLITEVTVGTFIMGIEMKLFQVWTNIVKNAIDAFEEVPEKENKYIRIYSEMNDDEVAIHFENNGPKISEQDQEKIFRKFYTTKQVKNGTGLGLSIVSSIISEHYGRISLDSNDLHTTFTIIFPNAGKDINEIKR